MEKELIPINFNLSIRAGDTSNQISLNPDSAGQNITFTILSYREKLINGKRPGEFSYVSDIEGPNLTSRDWIHINYEKQVTYMGYPALEISMKIDKNDSGSSRNTSLVYTQNPSGKVITITITQKAVDIPMYVEIWGRYDKNSLTTYKDLPYILNYNGQYVISGTLPASLDEYLLIPVTKVPWSDKGSYTEPTAIFELYLKGSQLVDYSDFYFNISFYDAQGLFYGCNREYSQAINYKIDTVDPSDWTPSGSLSYGSITVKKGNLSPSDFSGGILVELILGSKINGYIKRVMLRVKIN